MRGTPGRHTQVADRLLPLLLLRPEARLVQETGSFRHSWSILPTKGAADRWLPPSPARPASRPAAHRLAAPHTALHCVNKFICIPWQRRSFPQTTNGWSGRVAPALTPAAAAGPLGLCDAVSATCRPTRPTRPTPRGSVRMSTNPLPATPAPRTPHPPLLRNGPAPALAAGLPRRPLRHARWGVDTCRALGPLPGVPCLQRPPPGTHWTCIPGSRL